MFLQRPKSKNKNYWLGWNFSKNSKSLEMLNQAKLIAENHELEHKQEELATLASVKKTYLSLQEDLKNSREAKRVPLKT